MPNAGTIGLVKQDRDAAVLVYGIISPHPPIILPEVGKGDLGKVRQTVAAMEWAAEQLGKVRPGELIIISPHEEHGFAVPLYYLGKNLPNDAPVEEILVTELSYEYYYEYGQRVGERLRGKDKRSAIIASGDLSHVLKADGPYGFNAAGLVLDTAIVKAVGERNAAALLAIDPAVVEDGAECGLRSILFLLGALDGMEVKTEVLSYEGPFGVGYMVATFEPEVAV